MRLLRPAALLLAAAALLPAAADAKTKPGSYTMTYKGTTKQGEKVNIVVKFRLYKNPDNPPGQLDIRNDVTATVNTAATVHCDADPTGSTPAVDKRYEFKGASTVHYVTDFTQADLSGFMGGKSDPGVTAGANIGATVKKLKDRLPTKKSVMKGSISASADPTEAGGRTCIAGDPQKGVAFTAKRVATTRR
jgi:hypothetical protein